MRFHGLHTPPIQGFLPRHSGGSPPPPVSNAFVQQDGASYFLLQNGTDKLIKQ